MTSAAAVVVAALSLLGVDRRTADVIRLIEYPPAGVSREAQAFVQHDPDVIYIITSTRIFQDAWRAERPENNLRAFRLLASVITHELWHLQHGPDERSAYQMQLTTLAALGADQLSSDYQSVKKAMLIVLRRQQSTGSVRIVRSSGGALPTREAMLSSNMRYQDYLGNYFEGPWPPKPPTPCCTAASTP